jgi:hypothetical protein
MTQFYEAGTVPVPRESGNERAAFDHIVVRLEAWESMRQSTAELQRQIGNIDLQKYVPKGGG